MNPIYYRIKCTKCDNVHIEYKLMNINEKNEFVCAVCTYKLVIISGYFAADIHAKCSVCKCIFFNKNEYEGDIIKCPLDSKQNKQCEICDSIRNDVILRWDKNIKGDILLCCDSCYF